VKGNLLGGHPNILPAVPDQAGVAIFSGVILPIMIGSGEVAVGFLRFGVGVCM